jgi:hypothetical protein
MLEWAFWGRGEWATAVKTRAYATYSESGNGEILSVRNMMHAQVKEADFVALAVEAFIERDLNLHNEIFLVKRFAVEELVEVYDWISWVDRVVGIHASRLGVVVLSSVELVCGPMRRSLVIWRIHDGEMRGACSAYFKHKYGARIQSGGGLLTWADPVTGIFSEPVWRVFVNDWVHGRGVWRPVDLAVVFWLDEAPVQLHRIANVALGPGISDIISFILVKCT